MTIITLQKSPELLKPLRFVQDTLKHNCLTSYLHGSAVTSGLRPTSDLDLLFIIKSPLDDEIRKILITGLLSLSGAIGNKEGKRALEVVIFLLDDLIAESYPIRCEFIYGEWLRESILVTENPLSICAPFKDAEMTLLYAQAQREAVLLNGLIYLQNLPKPPFLEIKKAIQILAVSLSKNYQGDERNVLLTLARMVRTLMQTDFISKSAASDWILPMLTEKAGQVLMIAKNDYLTGKGANWSDLETDVHNTIQELQQLIQRF